MEGLAALTPPGVALAPSWCSSDSRYSAVPHAARSPRRDAAANRERLLDAATQLVRTLGREGAHGGGRQGRRCRHRNPLPALRARQGLLSALVHRSFGLALGRRVSCSCGAGASARGGSFVPRRHTARSRPLRPAAPRGPGHLQCRHTRAAGGGARGSADAARPRSSGGRSSETTSPRSTSILAASLLSRPLPNAGDWDLLAVLGRSTSSSRGSAVRHRRSRARVSVVGTLYADEMLRFCVGS